ASRLDVMQYFSESLKNAQHLHIETKELQKEKGIYIRAPYIPTPNQIDFVEKQTFLAGWFADRRPLLGTEIASIVFNAERNALGQAVITGFSQVEKYLGNISIFLHLFYMKIIYQMVLYY